MLSYSVCPPSPCACVRPSVHPDADAVYPSWIEESFTAFVKAGERARPPARRDEEEGKKATISLSVCLVDFRGESAERHRASDFSKVGKTGETAMGLVLYL